MRRRLRCGAGRSASRRLEPGLCRCGADQATRCRSKCCVGSTTPAPAPRAALPTSPISSKRTRIGRARRRCASTPRKRWRAKPTRSPPIGLSAIPPVSAAGQVRAAEMKLNAGDVAGGTAALRAAWVEAISTRSTKRVFSPIIPVRIRPEDDEKRLDRLLWDGKDDGGAAHAAAGAAGLPRLGRGASGACRCRPRPPSCWLRACRRRCAPIPACSSRKCAGGAERDMTDAAVAILRGKPGDPVRPEAWWRERQIVARRRARRRQSPISPTGLPSSTVLLDGKAYADAEFLLGYIALRFKKDPALAFDHFSHILTRADTPYAKARAGILGRPRRRSRGEIRSRRENGMPPAPSTWRPFTASSPPINSAMTRRRTRFPSPSRRRRSVPISMATKWCAQRGSFFALGDRGSQQGFLAAAGGRRRRPRPSSRCSPPSPSRTGASIWRSRWPSARSTAGTPLMIHGYPITALAQRRHHRARAAVRDHPAGKRVRARCGQPGRGARTNAADAGDGKLYREQNSAAVLDAAADRRRALQRRLSGAAISKT